MKRGPYPVFDKPGESGVGSGGELAMLESAQRKAKHAVKLAEQAQERLAFIQRIIWLRKGDPRWKNPHV